MKLLVLALAGCALLASLDAKVLPKLKGKNALLESFMAMHREPTPPPTQKDSRIVSEGTIRQNLDHFNADNLDTFQQRFLSNYEHYDPDNGGPLFILVGAEWPISEGWLMGGHFYDMAEEHGAAMFYVEHRFYGRSFPENRTADLETLQFLTAEQAMYDVAYFVEQIRYMLPQFVDSQIILAGPSIAGSLVTWYQRVYHDQIAGAWASSAPLLATADFVEAKEVSGAVLRQLGGEACHNRIRNAFADLEALFDASNFTEVRRVMNVCDSSRIETQRGRWAFFEILSSEFLFLAALSAPEIYQLGCGEINGAPSDLEGLAAAAALMFDDECIDFDYEMFTELLSEDEWINEFNLEARLFIYQLCSQFGWYPSSTSRHQPFGSSFPVELFYSMCEDVYQISEETINQNIAATNERFGGLNPGVENVITTQGMNDPFRPLGLQDSAEGNVNVHIIQDGGHISDFFSYSGYDPDSVRIAKRLVADTIRSFLAADKK